MNYYNPYYYMLPANNGGLFGNILKSGINWSGILNGAQRTLNLVNQAIPLVKQASPMVKNAKTMFKVMNEFKKIDTPKVNNKIIKTSNKTVKTDIEEKENIEINNSNGPTFFI